MNGTDGMLDVMRHAGITTRQLAGSIVRDEIARGRLTIRGAGEAWGLAASTLAKVTAGRDVVDSLTLRQIEGGLGLPTRYLDYVLDADIERIERLPSRSQDPEAGIREDLRHFTVEALRDMAIQREVNGR